ncbi:MAG: pilus (MSHA type) biosis protein MshL [Magnetococcales bacterium]|nr:pilus (MSHA type) biosis protein MshL [Magnetococcales bacterium]
MPIQFEKHRMTSSIWKGRRRGAWILGTILGGVLIASCQTTDIKASKSHFLRPTDPPAHITGGTDIPPEVVAELKDGIKPGSRDEVYTITVTEMPVRDLLFALARDANKNIDVYPGISGRVTLSAIDQTLPQILDRVAKQVGIRYEIDGETVIVSPDRPYLKIYQVDYINVTRDSVSANKVSTQLDTSNLVNPDMSGADANQSSSSLTTHSTNRFWRTLTQNIQSIIGSEKNNAFADGGSSAGSGGVGSISGTSSSVIPAAGADGGVGAIVPPDGGGAMDVSGSSGVGDKEGIVAVNPEAGLISVYASSTQHERIQRYLDTVLDNVHRQVLIESTVVEVELGDGFQEGVDWNKVFSPAGIAVKGVFSTMNPIDKPLDFFTIQRTGGSDGTVSAALKVLETFGNMKVLSSPKIMALNNQSALLKVVQNKVFFTLESSTTAPSTAATTTPSTATAQIPVFNTKIHTVPVGLIMSVTPQISDNDIVSLNVRPTISRITSWINDPNPALQRNTLTTGLEEAVISRIPEIEVKEMETMMRVHSGQVAVMGGLMQDRTDEKSNGIPVLGRLPGIGFLFGNQERDTHKSELVIFLRPVVMSQGKPRNVKDVLVQQSKKPQAMVQSEKPGQKSAPVAPAAKDVPALDKGETLENGQGDGAIPEPVETQEVPAPAAMAPGGSYLDFTMPGGVVSVDANPGPAGASGTKAAANAGDANASAHIAPPPAQPALLPDEEEEGPALPMDYPGHEAYDRWPDRRPVSGMARGGAPGMAKAPAQGGVYLELGSFRQQALADNVQSQVSAMGLPISREQAMVAGTPYQRVRSGPYGNRKEASQARDRISSLTGIQAKLAAN